MHKFYFSCYIDILYPNLLSHQLSAFALHFDIEKTTYNISRHTSRILFLTLCYNTLVAKTGRKKKDTNWLPIGFVFHLKLLWNPVI